VELVATGSQYLHYTNYHPLVIKYLEDAREWDKLGCWISIIWAIWGPNRAANLESATRSLVRGQPGAFQKLERWIEVLQRGGREIELFRSLCEQRNLNVAEPHTL